MAEPIRRSEKILLTQPIRGMQRKEAQLIFNRVDITEDLKQIPVDGSTETLYEIFQKFFNGWNNFMSGGGDMPVSVSDSQFIEDVKVVIEPLDLRHAPGLQIVFDWKEIAGSKSYFPGGRNSGSVKYYGLAITQWRPPITQENARAFNRFLRDKRIEIPVTWET